MLVLGSGPLGIFATAVAKDHGAKQVLTVGAPANRLEVTRRMGADAVLNLETTSPPSKTAKAWVREHTGRPGRRHRGPVRQQRCDAGRIDDAAQRRALRPHWCRRQSRARSRSIVCPEQITFFNVRSGEPRHWLQALDFLDSRKDRFPFDDMISASYSLENVNEAMAAMASYAVVKPVIAFS